MVTILAVAALALLALALLATGFVAVFREDQMRSPWFYWAWGIVVTLVMSVFISMSTWISVANFVLLLITAYMWNREEKEEA